MRKIKLFLMICLLGGMLGSCSTNKSVCKQKVKPADVWYGNKHNGKVYR